MCINKSPTVGVNAHQQSIYRQADRYSYRLLCTWYIATSPRRTSARRVCMAVLEKQLRRTCEMQAAHFVCQRSGGIISMHALACGVCAVCYQIIRCAKLQQTRIVPRRVPTVIIVRYEGCVARTAESYEYVGCTIRVRTTSLH